MEIFFTCQQPFACPFRECKSIFDPARLKPVSFINILIKCQKISQIIPNQNPIKLIIHTNRTKSWDFMALKGTSTCYMTVTNHRNKKESQNLFFLHYFAFTQNYKRENISRQIKLIFRKNNFFM
jgi:hypothetical protein